MILDKSTNTVKKHQTKEALVENIEAVEIDKRIL
jgi:hypothetical protein